MVVALVAIFAVKLYNLHKPEQTTEEAFVDCVLCEIPVRDRDRPPEEKEVLHENPFYYIAAPLGRSRETHQMVVPMQHINVTMLGLYIDLLYGVAVKIGKEFGSFEIYTSSGEHSGVTVPGHAHLQVVRYDAGRNSTGMGTALMKDVVDFMPPQLVGAAREVCAGRLRPQRFG